MDRLQPAARTTAIGKRWFDYKQFQNRAGEAPAEPKRLNVTAQQELRPPK